jgi:predicted dehydrogenase
VVGFGRRGRTHTRILNGLEDTRVAAVCDISEEARDAASQEFGVAKCYADVDRMLDAEELDAVFVVMPAHLNAEFALPCLRRGANTLLEKPPGLSAAETAELRDAAAESGAKAMVGWNRRFHPVIVRARSMVEARGPVTQLVGEFHKSIKEYVDSGRYPEHLLANILLESPIHSIDLIRAIAGSEVAEVHSVVRRVASDYRDVHAALVLFENGCVAQLTHNFTTDARLERYEIHGRGISAYLEGVTDGVVVCDGERHPLGASATNGTEEQARFFLDCVRNDTPVTLPAADLDEAVKTMELSEAILAGSDPAITPS